jgi:hypothetical protein
MDWNEWKTYRYVWVLSRKCSINYSLSKPMKCDKSIVRHKQRTCHNSPFVRTPERGTSVGVRGLSGDGLPSKDNAKLKLIRRFSGNTT